MSQVLETSVVVRVVRWIVRDSPLGKAAAAVGRLFAGVDEAFVRAAADKDARTDPERVRTVLRSSAIVGLLDRLFAAPAAAWEASRIRPLVDTIRQDVAAMSLDERVRLLGMMLGIALFTRAALYVAGGNALTGGTLLAWGVVLAAAGLMVAAPQQIAAGWTDWKQRRG